MAGTRIIHRTSRQRAARFCVYAWAIMENPAQTAAVDRAKYSLASRCAERLAQFRADHHPLLEAHIFGENDAVLPGFGQAVRPAAIVSIFCGWSNMRGFSAKCVGSHTTKYVVFLQNRSIIRNAARSSDLSPM